MTDTPPVCPHLVHLERGRCRECEGNALLNLAMDRYADLLAYVTVNLSEHATELGVHTRRFFDTSHRVQDLVGQANYGPEALARHVELGLLAAVVDEPEDTDAQPRHVDAVCLRCSVPFRIGEPSQCDRAPDRGPHEALPHQFRSGRRDGRCAEPNPFIAGAMCGFERDDQSRHIQDGRRG